METTGAKLHIDDAKINSSESEMAKFGQRITQNEVEEQLKVMKQKKQNRMTFMGSRKTNTTEQSTKTLTFKSAVDMVIHQGNTSSPSENTVGKISDEIMQENIDSSKRIVPQVSSPGSVRCDSTNDRTKLEQRKTMYFRENECPLDLSCLPMKNVSYNSSAIVSKNKHIEIEKISSRAEERFPVELPRQQKKIHEAASISCKLPTNPNQRRGDRVLRKFQLNWNNLNDILENDYDVDLDEFDDLKNNLEEVHSLLAEYQEGLKKLGQNRVPAISGRLKLDHLMNQVEGLKSQIEQFRGLKRDSGYLHLANRLSNIFLEVHKVPDTHSREKNEVLLEVNTSIKNLEARVDKNQSFLEFILNEQVLCIINNHYERSNKK